MIKIIQNLCHWCRWPSIKKGVIKGYNVKSLPDNINKFINNTYIRILRVIGGISVILALSKQYLELPLVIQNVVLSLALLQFIQITVISLIKTIYLIKKLIYNPEEFEVRKPHPLTSEGEGGLYNKAVNIAKIIPGLKSFLIICLSGAFILGTGFIVNLLLHSVNVDSQIFTSNIQESSLLGPISDFRSAIKEVLSELSSEELCCISNAIGFFYYFNFCYFNNNNFNG